jgi:hypothetical protein
MPMPNAAMLTDSDRVGQSVYVACKLYNPNDDFQLHFWSCPEDGERYSRFGAKIKVSLYTAQVYMCIHISVSTTTEQLPVEWSTEWQSRNSDVSRIVRFCAPQPTCAQDRSMIGHDRRLWVEATADGTVFFFVPFYYFLKTHSMPTVHPFILYGKCDNYYYIHRIIARGLND